MPVLAEEIFEQRQPQIRKENLVAAVKDYFFSVPAWLSSWKGYSKQHVRRAEGLAFTAKTSIWRREDGEIIAVIFAELFSKILAAGVDEEEIFAL